MKSSNTGYNQEKFYVFNTTQFSYTVQISGTFAFGYGVSVSSPHHEYLVEKLQKRATKLIISSKHLKYEERLRYLNLTHTKVSTC